MEVIPHKLFGNLRAVIVEGTPWFCGKDVAVSLGYNQPHKAIKRHVSENQKCIYETLRELLADGTFHTPAEMQAQTVFVNGAGVYSPVLGSKLPAAVASERTLQRHSEKYHCVFI